MNEFIIETREGLDGLDQDLVLLEEDPNKEGLISQIFRNVHTIKGSAGFLGLEKLGEIAHVGENLLSLLRDEAIGMSQEIISALLAMADAIRDIIGHVEVDESEGDTDFSGLIAELARLAASEPKPAEVVEADVVQGPEAAGRSEAPAEPVAESAPATPAMQPVAAPEEACAKAASEPASLSGGAQAGEARRTGDATIRVDVDLLDKLMNQVGELVLARNQILQHSNGTQDPMLTAPLQRLNHVTTELQEGVMKTRMQPIGNAWSKFPRVVRDLSISCGKEVRLEMEGHDTELDKTILESIRDPLTHAIRNAVDHGIEAADVREAAGKPSQGLLLLRAFHESGQVNIEIIDDGAGIDPSVIRNRAIEKGLVTSEHASRMSTKELVNLVTLPGFSTAETVTSVSGRGVGMDVVRTNIEEVGGTLDIHSVPGQGATIRIKIPLTLAIIPALTIESAGERFAIPQVNLLELVRLEGDQVANIESIGSASVYRLRDRLLPLIYLESKLGRSGSASEILEGEGDGSGSDSVAALNIVVLQAGERAFGLVVDEILDTEEIVVKPLGQQLKDVPLFAGAAIMGDGRVALILDVMGLATTAGGSGEGDPIDQIESGAQQQQAACDSQTLLLIDNPDGSRCALPMSAVARLEEFDASVIESSGGREVVQYRGKIMPLVRLSQRLGHVVQPEESERMQVVVVRDQGRDVGIQVHRILDTVTDTSEVSGESSHLVEGAVTIEGRVTDLIDIKSLIS